MKIKYLKNLSKNIIKKYQDLDWSYERVDACPYFEACPTEGMVNELRKFFPMINIIAPQQKGQFQIYHYTENELEAIYNDVLKRTKDNQKFIFYLRKKWQELIGRFYGSYQEFKKFDYKNLSNRQLAIFHNKFYDIFRKSVYIPFFIEGITVGKRKIIDENLMAFLKSKNQDKYFNQIYQALTTPEEPSFMAEAHIDLLKIIKCLKPSERSIFKKNISVTKNYLNKNQVIGNKINNYIDQHSWLLNSYFEVKKYSLHDFAKDTCHFLTQKKSLDQQIKSIFDINKVSKEKRQILNKFYLPKVLRAQLNLLAYLTKWQDERKKSIFYGLEIMDKFLTEISRRTKIKKHYLKFMLPQEYEKILNKKLKPLRLKERTSSCLVIWQPGQVIVLSGLAARRANKEIFKQKIEKNVKEFHGIAASAGKAKGIVKILLSSKEDHKMKHGDILVAGMTRPDYIHSLRKAKAIITDEGGITCHAAIVSRELGIPCIVGTKVATQVLKDGDLVEVDANRGIVKKL